MSRKEVAVLRLVIALQKKEADSVNGSEKTVLDFEGGYSAEEVLEDVKNGNKSRLPIPTDGEYKGFGWTKVGTRKIQGENEEYNIVGSGDIRIMDYRANGVDTLKLFANNAGDFSKMREEFDSVLNEINYPIFAEDRQDS